MWKVSRKTGDAVITAVSNYIKNNLSKEYIFVRYMGPKFAIVFSGADKNGVFNFMTDMKKKVERIRCTRQHQIMYMIMMKRKLW